MNVDKEQLKMIMSFVETLVLEVGIVILAVVVILTMTGFFSR